MAMSIEPVILAMSQVTRGSIHRDYFWVDQDIKNLIKCELI
jgi:hypothetical protein